MNDDYVGYANPPRKHQFPKGRSGNPKGRPKRPVLSADQIIANVLKRPIIIHNDGRETAISFAELLVRTLVKRSLEGDIASANALLRLRSHAERFADPGVEAIYVTDWLPDYPGQTGLEKTKKQAKSL